jgi:hypothetical protein
MTKKNPTSWRRDRNEDLVLVSTRVDAAHQQHPWLEQWPPPPREEEISLESQPARQRRRRREAPPQQQQKLPVALVAALFVFVSS